MAAQGPHFIADNTFARPLRSTAAAHADESCQPSPANRNAIMYQANLPDILAKTSPLPRTVQDYNAARANAGSFLVEIEKAHANPLPGDPLTKSTFSQSGSPTSGLTYYDLETGAKFVYPLL